jgi:hypothetical protein
MLAGGGDEAAGGVVVPSATNPLSSHVAESGADQVREPGEAPIGREHRPLTRFLASLGLASASWSSARAQPLRQPIGHARAHHCVEVVAAMVAILGYVERHIRM